MQKSCPVILIVLSFHALQDPNLVSPAYSQPQTSVNVHCSASSSGEYLVAIDDNGVISVWDSRSRKPVIECQAESKCAEDYAGIRYAFSRADTACFDEADEGKVFFCNFQGLFAWNWKEKKAPTRIFDAKDLVVGTEGFVVNAMSCSPSTRWLSVCYGEGVIVCIDLSKKTSFRIATGKTLNSEGWDSLFFLDDSKGIFFHGDSVRSFDVLSKKADVLLKPDNAESTAIIKMGLAPASKELITAHSNGDIRICHLVTGKSELFMKRRGNFHSVAISKDGRLVAAEDERGVVSIYSRKNRQELAKTLPEKSGFGSIGFLCFGNTLFLAGEYAGVRFLNGAKKKP